MQGKVAGSDDGHDFLNCRIPPKERRVDIENGFNDRRYVGIQTMDLIIRETLCTPFFA